jgi:ABC-type Fe3+/spermidine/putrescine transport system ATPase subunit
VYEHPANPFVGRFLGEANLIEVTVAAQSGGAARLLLPAGQELRAPGGGGCRDGPRMLFIRPERIEITPGANVAGGLRDNALAGRIRRCAFLGNILRYGVDVGGVSVTVDRQNAAGMAPLPPGAPVILRWPVADSLILPAEE